MAERDRAHIPGAACELPGAVDFGAPSEYPCAADARGAMLVGSPATPLLVSPRSEFPWEFDGFPRESEAGSSAAERGDEEPDVGNVIKKRRKKMRKHKKRKLLKRARHKRKR